MLRGILILLSAQILGGCHFFKPAPVSVPVIASGPTSAALVTRSFPVKKTTVERLVFKVDSASSTGHLKTTLDPIHLGARHSDCKCLLRGTLRGKLTTKPDGSRTLLLDKIHLVTTTDAVLHFDWTPLIGSIRAVIPAGSLTISDHSRPGALSLDPNGRFARSGYKFRVGGTAIITGRGLLLKKKIGQAEKDLTIKQTDPIRLAGSLLRRDGSWILHLPAAVLQDRYELDDQGSYLELKYTAKLTAIAR
jgi:hypothetical protein